MSDQLRLGSSKKVGALILGLVLLTALVQAGFLNAKAATEERAFFLLSGLPEARTPEIYQGSFLDLSGGAMLSRLKVQLAPEDKVFYFPDPSLGIGSQVLVYRAQVFLVQDGNSSEVYRSWASSIGELLQEKGIAVTSQDQIVPSVDTVIQYSSRTASVSITRVSEEVITTYQSVPYQTKTVEDPQLERGKRVTEVAGVNGKLAIQFLVRRENGVEVSKKESQREVLKATVTEVNRKGTKIVTYGTGGASWYGGVGMRTAAHLSLPFGTMVKVINTQNGKSVVVRIADRGPYVTGRIIDLSEDAFESIASLGTGVVSVRVEKAE